MQTAFTTGRLILMDKAFVDRGVDNWLCSLESGLGFFLVAFFNGEQDFLDESAQVAALSGIADTALFGLFRAFLSLSCVSHVSISLQSELTDRTLSV